MVPPTQRFNELATPFEENAVLDLHPRNSSPNILSMQEFRKKEAEIAKQKELAHRYSLAKTAIADQSITDVRAISQSPEKTVDVESELVKRIKDRGSAINDARNANFYLDDAA